MQVGAQALPFALVTAVAAEQRIEAVVAAEQLIADATLAAQLLEQQPFTYRYLRRIALARRLSERLLAQARARGPASDDEVARFTARTWWQLDRPISSRTTHAVVLMEKNVGAEAQARARALAERIRLAVAGASQPTEFRARAEAVDSEGLTVRIEDLPAVTADGRVIDLKRPPAPGGSTDRFDLTFARAANQIAQVGDQSAVVETDFGFHVLLLTERIAELRLPLDERRNLLHEEIVNARAHSAERELLSQSAQQWPVAVERSALALTELVRVSE